jgi:hypothetical protein
VAGRADPVRSLKLESAGKRFYGFCGARAQVSLCQFAPLARATAATLVSSSPRPPVRQTPTAPRPSPLAASPRKMINDPCRQPRLTRHPLLYPLVLHFSRPPFNARVLPLIACLSLVASDMIITIAFYIFYYQSLHFLRKPRFTDLSSKLLSPLMVLSIIYINSSTNI